MTSTHPLLGAVVGTPVSHSLSPYLYAAAFQELGIVGSYQAIECDAASLPQVFGELVQQGIKALSVTMPLKESVITVLSSLDEDAVLLNAVNCVSFNGDESVGHNTDGDGCCDALAEQGGADLVDAHAVVLGAGGTGRSVALALGRRGAHVAVINRTQSHTDSLIARLEPAITACGGSVRSGSLADVRSATVVVNTTSVGMNSTETPLPTDVLHAGLVVLDAVYQPMTTALLAAAQTVGATTVDGLWMLIQQARRQCELQFGAKPSAHALREAAERELVRRHK